MKRFLFVSMLTYLLYGAHAQQSSELSYLPILEEDKVWILEPENCMYLHDIPYFVRVSVVGDTVIGDKEAWIVEKLNLYISREETERKYLIEEDKKLFYLNPDSVWSPLLDFNPSVGEVTIEEVCDGEPRSGWRVREEGMVHLEDGVHRYLKMPWEDYWIEGIGSVYQNYLTTSSDPIPTGSPVFPVLTKCFQDGWIIFDKTKFEHFSAIDNITYDAPKADTAIYDLHGRKVTEILPGSVYIRAGKKFVAK